MSSLSVDSRAYIGTRVRAYVTLCVCECVWGCVCKDQVLVGKDPDTIGSLFQWMGEFRAWRQ